MEQVLRLGIDPRPGERGAKRFQAAAGGATASAHGLATAVGTATAAIAAFAAARGVGAAVRATMEWETALTGIAKTVDLTTAELHAMGEEVRSLSEAIPVTANELAGVAEAAGQLGIARENIVSFTRVMADLGVATNLTSEEAAVSMARLANVMQTPQDQFDRLGATVVDLGNNLATTEREIVEFGQRMAGAGAIAGLTEANVLAIGGALSSVGVEAEAGGTAVQKVLIDINTSVAQGNAELSTFAETAGLTAEQFASLWRDDAGEAFTLFVEGLGRAGDDATTILGELGLNNQRLTRAFLSLGNAGDLLRRSVSRGTEAWAENTALTEEAERFYATLSNQVKVLQNQITNAAAEIGENFTPALQFAIDNTDELTDAALAVTAAVGTAGATAAFLAVTPAVLGTAGAFTSLAFQIRSTAGAVALLQIAIGPTGWLILGVTTLAGVMFSTRKRTRELTEALEEQAESLARTQEEMAGLGETAALTNLTLLTHDLRDATAEVDRIKEAIAEAGGGRGMGGGDTALMSDLREAEASVDRIETLLTAAGQRYTEFGETAEEVAGDTEETESNVEGIARAAAEAADAAQQWADAERLGLVSTEEAVGAMASLHGELQGIAEDQSAAMDERIAAAEAVLRVERDIRTAIGLQIRVLDDVIDRMQTAQELRARMMGGGGVGGGPGGIPDPDDIRRITRDPEPPDFDWDAVFQGADDASRALIGAADNFGLVDGAARDAARGVSDLIGGLQGIMSGEGGLLGQIMGGIGIAGAAFGIGQALFRDTSSSPEEVREAAQAERRRVEDEQRAWERTLREFVQQGLGVEPLQAAIDAVKDDAFDVIRGFYEDLYGDDRVTKEMIEGILEDPAAFLEDTDFSGSLEGLEDIIRSIVAQIEAAEEALERQRQATMGNIEVRRLMAQGLDEEAEALRQQITDREELRSLEEQFAGSGFLEEMLDALREVQELEREAAEAMREAAQQRARAAFEGDLVAREAALGGDDRGALEARLRAQAESELERARDLLEAGDITEEQFRRLAEVLGGELSEALEDFDAAARRAAEARAAEVRAMEDDIALRELAVAGRDEEAERLRLEIKQRKEMAEALDLVDDGSGDLIDRLDDLQEAEREALEDRLAGRNDVRSSTGSSRRSAGQVAVTAVTEATQLRTNDILLSQLVRLQNIEFNTAMMAGGRFNPGGVGARPMGVQAGGGPTLSVTVIQNLPNGDRQTVRTAAEDGTAQGINRALGADAQRRVRFSGEHEA